MGDLNYLLYRLRIGGRPPLVVRDVGATDARSSRDIALVVTMVVMLVEFLIALAPAGIGIYAFTGHDDQTSAGLATAACGILLPVAVVAASVAAWRFKRRRRSKVLIAAVLTPLFAAVALAALSRLIGGGISITIEGDPVIITNPNAPQGTPAPD